MEFIHELNWIAVGQIILIDLLLGGDNAILIALACRNLPPRLRMHGIVWGTVGAIGLRILLIAFAVTLLTMPGLKLAGGALLLWIGVKLLAPEDDGHDDVEGSERLLGAIRTIIVADLIMSIDNVVAIASAAERVGGKQQMLLVALGVAISIPVIVCGSRLVMVLMERYSIIVTAGAGLLGYLAGAIAFSDDMLTSRVPQAWLEMQAGDLSISLPGLAAAAAVVLLGKWLGSRSGKKS